MFPVPKSTNSKLKPASPKPPATGISRYGSELFLMGALSNLPEAAGPAAEYEPQELSVGGSILFNRQPLRVKATSLPSLAATFNESRAQAGRMERISVRRSKITSSGTY